MHELIVNALRDFSFNGIFRDENDSAADGEEIKDNYIVWNYANDTGYLFSDDEPSTEIAYLQIHWFIKDDVQFDNQLKQMRKALLNGDFTYPSFLILYEKETKLRHIVFSLQYAD